MESNNTDLETAADVVFNFLDRDRDWDQFIDQLGWTGREVVGHLADVSLRYSLALGGRWATAWPTTPEIDTTAPIEELLTLARAGVAVLGTVISSCPAGTRAFHATGMADQDGFTAMMIDELVMHASDIATAHGEDFLPPPELTVGVLDRLFPWWPGDADPWSALLWANGRADLPNRATLGEAWVWHAAPVAEWNGKIPHWDSEKNVIATEADPST